MNVNRERLRVVGDQALQLGRSGRCWDGSHIVVLVEKNMSWL